MDDFESAEALYHQQEQEAVPYEHRYIEIDTDQASLLKLRHYLDNASNNISVDDLLDFITNNISHDDSLHDVKPGNLIGVKSRNTAKDVPPEFLFYICLDDNNQPRVSYVMGEEPGQPIDDIPGMLAVNFGTYMFDIKNVYNLPFIPYGYEELEEED